MGLYESSSLPPRPGVCDLLNQAIRSPFCAFAFPHSRKARSRPPCLLRCRLRQAKRGQDLRTKVPSDFPQPWNGKCSIIAQGDKAYQGTASYRDGHKSHRRFTDSLIKTPRASLLLIRAATIARRLTTYRDSRSVETLQPPYLNCTTPCRLYLALPRFLLEIAYALLRLQNASIAVPPIAFLSSLPTVAYNPVTHCS
jgi:hypothetical protein